MSATLDWVLFHLCSLKRNYHFYQCLLGKLMTWITLHCVASVILLQHKHLATFYYLWTWVNPFFTAFVSPSRHQLWGQVDKQRIARGPGAIWSRKLHTQDWSGEKSINRNHSHHLVMLFWDQSLTQRLFMLSSAEAAHGLRRGNDHSYGSIIHRLIRHRPTQANSQSPFGRTIGLGFQVGSSTQPLTHAETTAESSSQ